MDHCKDDYLLVIVIGWLAMLNLTDQNQRGTGKEEEILRYAWGILSISTFLSQIRISPLFGHPG